MLAAAAPLFPHRGTLTPMNIGGREVLAVQLGRGDFGAVLLGKWVECGAGAEWGGVGVGGSFAGRLRKSQG